MPKFFVLSDVHGFYDEMIAALNAAGFDKDNPDHWLIHCGDAFDRGSQPLEVMNYFLSLPRAVLIRGNHEDLLLDCCNRMYWYDYDVSNGTYHTICNLGDYSGLTCTFDDACIHTKGVIKPYINRLVNYFETKNYVFVHGWIPVIPNWRDAHFYDWDQATWLNGIDMARKGITEPGKTIVCGHWHCSYGHMLDSIGTDNLISEFNEDANWEPYYSDGIIAIDRCTAYTGEVNVLVIEDEFLD